MKRIAYIWLGLMLLGVSVRSLAGPHDSLSVDASENENLFVGKSSVEAPSADFHRVESSSGPRISCPTSVKEGECQPSSEFTEHHCCYGSPRSKTTTELLGTISEELKTNPLTDEKIATLVHRLDYIIVQNREVGCRELARGNSADPSVLDRVKRIQELTRELRKPIGSKIPRPTASCLKQTNESATAKGVAYAGDGPSDRVSNESTEVARALHNVERATSSFVSESTPEKVQTESDSIKSVSAIKENSSTGGSQIKVTAQNACTAENAQLASLPIGSCVGLDAENRGAVCCLDESGLPNVTRISRETPDIFDLVCASDITQSDKSKFEFAKNRIESLVKIIEETVAAKYRQGFDSRLQQLEADGMSSARARLQATKEMENDPRGVNDLNSQLALLSAGKRLAATHTVDPAFSALVSSYPFGACQTMAPSQLVGIMQNSPGAGKGEQSTVIPPSKPLPSPAPGKAPISSGNPKPTTTAKSDESLVDVVTNTIGGLWDDAMALIDEHLDGVVAKANVPSSTSSSTAATQTSSPSSNATDGGFVSAFNFVSPPEASKPSATASPSPVATSSPTASAPKREVSPAPQPTPPEAVAAPEPTKPVDNGAKKPDALAKNNSASGTALEEAESKPSAGNPAGVNSTARKGLAAAPHQEGVEGPSTRVPASVPTLSDSTAPLVKPVPRGNFQPNFIVTNPVASPTIVSVSSAKPAQSDSVNRVGERTGSIHPGTDDRSGVGTLVTFARDVINYRRGGASDYDDNGNRISRSDTAAPSNGRRPTSVAGYVPANSYSPSGYESYSYASGSNNSAASGSASKPTSANLSPGATSFVSNSDPAAQLASLGQGERRTNLNPGATTPSASKSADILEQLEKDLGERKAQVGTDEPDGDQALASDQDLSELAKSLDSLKDAISSVAQKTGLTDFLNKASKMAGFEEAVDRELSSVDSDELAADEMDPAKLAAQRLKKLNGAKKKVVLNPGAKKQVGEVSLFERIAQYFEGIL